jgi:hypothetical protein
MMMNKAYAVCINVLYLSEELGKATRYFRKMDCIPDVI